VDLGTSILGSATGVSAIFGTVTVIIKLIGARQPRGGNNGNGKCQAHGEIEKRLQDGDERMDQICRKTSAIGKVVLAIASHQKVPIEEIKKEMQELME
jgi:hypothetical protein